MPPDTGPVIRPLDHEELARRLGFEGALLKVPKARCRQWAATPDRQVTHAGERNGVELILSRRAASSPSFRGWVRALAKRAPDRRFLHLEVAPGGRLVAGIFRPGLRGPAATVSCDFDDALCRDVGALQTVGRELFAQRLADVLGREDVTARFFRAFRRHLVQLEGLWQGLDAAGSSPSARRDLTLATLCRLMFVAFLARTGRLGKRRDLRWLVEQPRGRGLYRDVLSELFFGTLNTPVADRSKPAQGLGPLPFLNGGLFEPLAVERRCRALSLPDAPLVEALDDLFEHYRFTTREVGDGARSVNPRMLGQVFEALMLADERRQSGTYYTPASVVGELAAELLAAAVVPLGDWASRWVEACLAGDEGPALTRPRRARLEARLARLRVLDPAVGSGALLLGVLDALVECRWQLGEALGLQRTRYALRRWAIAHNVYGVDRKAGAVRLCELRLWLSLVAEVPPGQPLEPLPNLDHHIRQGDSLREPPVGSAEALVPTASVAQSMAYAEAHGRFKHDVAAARRQAELDRLAQIIGQRRAAVERLLATYDALSQQRDLLGEPQRLSIAQRRDRRALEREWRDLDDGQQALERGELPFFSFRAAFPGVAANGGFDVVVGNPPWVRLHGIPAEERAHYRRRYQFCRGLGSGFSSQIDLSVVFLERALELARPDGVVGLLLPAKLFRAQYGRQLRRTLVRAHRVERFTDLSLRRRRMFAASNYPAWLRLRRGRPAADAVVELALVTPSGGQIRDWVRSDQLSSPGPPGAPWRALPRRALSALETMSASRVTLAEYGLTAQLGVKTGLNRVFLSSTWQQRGDRLLLTMDDGSQLDVAAELAPMVCRGRDLAPFAIDPAVRLLAAYDRAARRPLEAVPEELRAYFARHADRLERRKDAAGRRCAWRLFRTGGLLGHPKIVWRDIAPRLEAVFCPRNADIVPINTTYFALPVDAWEGYLVTALLNSLWVRLFAVSGAERAMTGYARFLAATVESIPWPERLKPRDRNARRLVELCQQAHGAWSAEVQAELDERVAWAYGLGPAEQAHLTELLEAFPQVACPAPDTGLAPTGESAVAVVHP